MPYATETTAPCRVPYETSYDLTANGGVKILSWQTLPVGYRRVFKLKRDALKHAADVAAWNPDIPAPTRIITGR